MRTLAGILAAVSLLLCVVFPVLASLGRMPEEATRFGFFAASAAWFIFASIRVYSPRKPGSK
jgi:hypothetical protein